MEKNIINGGFNGKIIYKWVIFHGYVKYPDGRLPMQFDDLLYMDLPIVSMSMVIFRSISRGLLDHDGHDV